MPRYGVSGPALRRMCSFTVASGFGVFWWRARARSRGAARSARPAAPVPSGFRGEGVEGDARAAPGRRAGFRDDREAEGGGPPPPPPLLPLPREGRGRMGGRLARFGFGWFACDEPESLILAQSERWRHA